MALLDKILWHIESHLGDDITLTQLSKACASSPYHMCRVFQQGVGLSIMGYVRARRLSVAAQAIAEGQNSVLSIALDAGYASHEAFTRAFCGYFGSLPSTVRDTRSLATLSLMEPLRMKQDMIVDVAKPDIRSRAGFRVVGLSLVCSFENSAGIPGLWQAFSLREDDVRGAVSGTVYYGVCYDVEDSGRFRYLAGVEAAGATEGMDFADLPAARYAVFTHSGHISDLPKTVYTIWNKSLPDHGFTPANTPDFELYDHRFDPQTGRGDVEIWVPIV